MILRTRIRRRTKTPTSLVVPSSASLQAAGDGRLVFAMAAARLLPPLLVLRSVRDKVDKSEKFNLRLKPATGRVKPTPTSTSQFVLHFQGGALLLARTSTKRAPELVNSRTRWTTSRPTLRAGQTPCACQSWWEHKRSSLRDILHCIFAQPRGKESAASKSCSTATEPSTPGEKVVFIFCVCK